MVSIFLGGPENARTRLAIPEKLPVRLLDVFFVVGSYQNGYPTVYFPTSIYFTNKPNVGR